MPRSQRERVIARALSAAEAPRRPGARDSTSASTSTPRNPSGSTSRSTCWRRCAAIRRLAGWNGVGFVVQAYQKRAYAVIDWIVELARATRRRIMLRLVKGAYWDSEIKRAQVEGLEGFSVFTRKVHTDVSYIACARRLLAAPDAVFPQFATHNALTLADHPRHGRREFLRRAIRVPVPARHGRAALQPDRRRAGATRGRAASTRRSARTRRCSPIWCAGCSRTAPTPRSSTASPTRRCRSTHLIADPVAAAQRDRAGRRAAPEDRAAARPLRAGAAEFRRARPQQRSAPRRARGMARQERANRMARRRRGRQARGRSSTPPTADVVGQVVDAARRGRRARLRRGGEGRAGLGGARAGRTRGDPRRRRGALRGEGRRARRADRAARRARRCPMRSATCARRSTSCAITALQSPAAISPTRRIAPLGTVVCISPWNFPIAIFTGQIAAALAAGNAVIAKPAEETPLVAAAAVQLLHEAGVPDDALMLAARRRRGRRAR